MGENSVERLGYSNIVTMQASAAGIVKGSPVKLSGVKTVALAAAADIHIGISLAAAAQYEMVSVLVIGPVVRLASGETVTAGNLVSAKASTGDGKWYTSEASAKCTAIALTTTSGAGDFDAVLISPAIA
jgi:hypothetical protein